MSKHKDSREQFNVRLDPKIAEAMRRELARQRVTRPGYGQADLLRELIREGLEERGELVNDEDYVPARCLLCEGVEHAADCPARNALK